MKSLGQLESVAELYGELCLGGMPLGWRSFPCRLDLPQREIDQFDRRLVAREVTLVADRLADPTVQTLDGIGGVDDSSLPRVRSMLPC